MPVPSTINSCSTSVCPVSARNLSLSRAGRELLAVTSVDFGTPDSLPCCTVIVGPNGAGKSVLVRALCNLLAPDSGQVEWAGRAPDAARRHRVGLMLQKPVLLRRSAQANLVYALRQCGLDRKMSARASVDALKRAGLVHISHVQAHRLSGGEQQRLVLARARLLKPDILFLDEPTANVDPASTLVIEKQLQEAVSEGLNVVLISHDQGQVKRMADRVLLMHQGHIVEHTDRQSFYDNPSNSLTKRWIRGELLV